MIVLLETLQFLHYEGKTIQTISTFENRLASMLYDDLTELELNVHSQIIVCIILTTFDNANDSYEQFLASKLTKQTLSDANLEFKPNSNKKLEYFLKNNCDSVTIDNDQMLMFEFTNMCRKLVARIAK